MSAGKVSPGFLRQLNIALQEVNQLALAANLALLDDSSEPTLSDYPRTPEVLHQIKVGPVFHRASAVR
jgi:hypothetical protein